MLCRACHLMFQLGQRIGPTGSRTGGTRHHSSPEGLLRASRDGCRICRRLCKKGMHSLPEPLQDLNGDRNAESTLTEFNFKPLYDQLDTMSNGRIEDLRSTGSWYELCLRWYDRPDSSEEEIVYYHLRDSSGFHSPEHAYVPAREVDDPATWALLSRWANNDQPGSSTFSKDSEGAKMFHPTRLLDLQPGDLAANSVRLVEANHCEPTRPYVTVSHCWGESTVIKLSTKSLPSFFEKGLSISELPRLYRDCIRVAKKLGQRYLWIDSLCIIQDSKDDWLKEASRMALVYRNSWCNIAATDAKDSNGTLFFTRDNHAAIRPLEVTLEWHPKGRTRFLLCETSPEEPLASRPLNQRGWALQEKLLAPRTISFGKDQIRWESLEGDASETFPGGEPSIIHGTDLMDYAEPPRANHMLKKWISLNGALSFRFSEHASDRQMSSWDRFWFSWRQIVEEYTGRLLTFGTDKVVAIAGIASVLSKGEGTTTAESKAEMDSSVLC